MKTMLLIVDDEPEIRDMLSRHYRFKHYEVLTAANGIEALGLIEDHKVDVLISDITMPGMDGIQLLREVRQSSPMIHTIMITGHVSQENILACMRHGADNCVFKPLSDLAELDQSVQDAVDLLERWKRKLLELHTIKEEAHE